MSGRHTRPRQLSLLKKPSLEHGGSLRRGRRKIARPLDPKRPLHVVLRSSRARGKWSLLLPRSSRRIQALLKETASKHRIRVYRFANVGNHLHLLVKGPSRAALQAFLREFPGRVAFAITGAKKGNPVGRFWDALAYSRVLSWGREFETVTLYLIKNLFEGAGLVSKSMRKSGFRVVAISGTDPP